MGNSFWEDAVEADKEIITGERDRANEGARQTSGAKLDQIKRTLREGGATKGF